MPTSRSSFRPRKSPSLSPRPERSGEPGSNFPSASPSSAVGYWIPALTAGTTRWMWRPLVNIQHQTPRRAAPARLCLSSLIRPVRDGAGSRQAGLACYSRAARRLPARGDIMASPRLLSNMARLPCLFRPQPWLKAAPFPRPPAWSHSQSLQPRLRAMPAAAPRSSCEPGGGAASSRLRPARANLGPAHYSQQAGRTKAPGHGTVNPTAQPA
jgi:hypothetical protein